MATPFAQLLEQLKAAQGDQGKLALATFDFAVAQDSPLKVAAEVAAIPHWFDGGTLAALLPDYAGEIDGLLQQLVRLPMVEAYSRGNGEPAWNLHEATRLAIRGRILSSSPARFRQISQRAADAYGSADPNALDFRLTCEHLYHALATQTDAGDAEMARVTGAWRRQYRFEPLQTLARLMEELLDKPAPGLLPRSVGWANLAIADARTNHQAAGVTRSFVEKAEASFRSLAASDPANFAWQGDHSASLVKLGDIALAQGDLPGASRYFVEAKTIRQHLAAVDGANAESQRDLLVTFERLGDIACEQGDLAGANVYFEKSREGWSKLILEDPGNTSLQRGICVPLHRLGDVAVTRGDLSEALRCFAEANAIAEHLAASDPTNSERQRVLSVSLNKLGDLAVAMGDPTVALRYYSEDLAIAKRLAASDSANDEWQRDLSVSLNKLGGLAEAERNLSEALRYFTEDVAVAERLAASDPTNALWQRDLAVSHYKIYQLAQESGDEELVETELDACFCVLDRMSKRGLHMDPPAAELYAQLLTHFKQL